MMRFSEERPAAPLSGGNEGRILADWQVCVNDALIFSGRRRRSVVAPPFF
jgi:hypothetical protein